MAWSPVRRANAGILRVEHPGDYANLNSNHLRDGTQRQLAAASILIIHLGSGIISATINAMIEQSFCCYWSGSFEVVARGADGAGENGLSQ